MRINNRIAALRTAMQSHQIDAYIIPSTDPHQSEYVASLWKSREWISGFTGSAGVVIITADHAGLWTDSRYFIQAESELANSEVVLHKQGVPHAPEHLDWLTNHLKPNSTVGVDGMLFSIGQIRHINSKLYPHQIELNTSIDLIGEIWSDRPTIPQETIFEHEFRYAGKSREEKMNMVRKQMKDYGAKHYLVSTLDDIAWLLNIRGSDVDYNPVAIAYFVLGEQASFLFIDDAKVPESVRENLEADNILLKPYADIANFLQNIPASDKILVDTQSISISLFKSIADEAVIKTKNLVRPLKAIKNQVEVEHIKAAMIKDGVALTRLYRWLDAELEHRTVPEAEVATQLSTFRKAQGDYYGESFSAIVGYKGNGAIVHYRPQADSCAKIEKEGMLLLDSGGQYHDGTTDITRTICLGGATAEQKRNYTLVLKGHIALAVAHFPKGTKGMQLDTLARMYLWNDGLNYGHGTGHGVGFFLNVHEPPQGFATNPSTSRGTTSFEVGMFTSNEPGFYKDGEYGIRIENLVLCVEDEKTPYGDFLKFDTLTLFPIATDLIDLSLMTEGEKQWLNNYHEEVYQKLAPQLTAEEQHWLKEKCEAI
jgi:Xaa-Pro aminopeptidase